MTDKEQLQEFYESDRGEREYYHSKINLKGKGDNRASFKLPITKDGCEALLEMVTEAMDIPLNDMLRQCFAGWVHHFPQEKCTFQFADLISHLHRQKAIDATWILDQEAKERRKLAEQELKRKAESTLTLAPGGEDSDKKAEDNPV